MGGGERELANEERPFRPEPEDDRVLWYNNIYKTVQIKTGARH